MPCSAEDLLFLSDLGLHCLLRPVCLNTYCKYGTYTDQMSPALYKHVIEGWAQDYSNSNIFLKPLFRGNLDPFVNNANLGAIAHTSNGT